MANEGAADSEKNASSPKGTEKKAAVSRREIPGNLPYIMAPGTLKNVLAKAIELAKPDKFNYDFLENVVKIKGGGARSCVPILKKMGFVNSDNSTTELYGRFRTQGGRSAAAYEGLRRAFPEIFKRSDYAYSLDENKIKDIIVEITGLQPNNQVTRAIRGTFDSIRSFIEPGFNHESAGQHEVQSEPDFPSAEIDAGVSAAPARLGLSYNINIIVPETSDVRILNAIFRAVKENLL